VDPPGHTWVLLNDGAGHFPSPTFYPLGGWLDEGDLDSDSHLDLVVSWSDVSIIALRGDGSGRFVRNEFPVGNGLVGGIANFSDDARPDVVGLFYDLDVSIIHYNTIPNYARPKGATPLRASLVPAFAQCQSPNTTHGAPLSFAACTPPRQVSDSATVGTPDANGAPSSSLGSVTLKVKVGQPGPPQDSDVSLAASVSDVRCQTSATTCGAANATGGADYSGELQATATIRLTDRRNGPTEIGTASDLSIPAALPCTGTTSTTAGATCAVTTTYNTILPGTVVDSVRAIWQLGQVQVFDGGRDGDADTPAGNTLFAVEGVFVP
jgi:hypothetical protein